MCVINSWSGSHSGVSPSQSQLPVSSQQSLVVVVVGPVVTQSVSSLGSCSHSRSRQPPVFTSRQPRLVSVILHAVSEPETHDCTPLHSPLPVLVWHRLRKSADGAPLLAGR